MFKASDIESLRSVVFNLAVFSLADFLVFFFAFSTFEDCEDFDESSPELEQEVTVRPRDAPIAKAPTALNKFSFFLNFYLEIDPYSPLKVPFSTSRMKSAKCL